jgi:hypothetical protein
MVLVGAYVLWQFPGQRLGLAWSVGTGQGIEALQSRTDRIESRIIRRRSLSTEDQRYLADLYAVVATGAWHMPPLHQSGRLMDHYLEGSGEPLELDRRIFLASPKVTRKLGELRTQARRRAPLVRGARAGGDGYVWSTRFYMPDRAHPDSFYGLYWGRIGYRAGLDGSGQRLHLHWRAEVDWRWPRYAELLAKYGTYRAEVVPIPNLRSLRHGNRHALRLSNGLGGYLEEAGLARHFLAYAEWDETLPMSAIR